MSESQPKIERSLRVCIPAYKDLCAATVNSLFALRNQTMLAERAAKEDYILWVDSDMVFYPQHFFALHEALEKDPTMGLISATAVRRDGSGAFCVNWRKGRKGWNPQTYVQERCMRHIEDKENPIVPVDVTGLAFTVMKTEVLSRIKRPWFQPAWVKNADKSEGQPEYLFYGEDSAFIRRLQDRGYRPSVHFGVHVGHIGENIYTPPLPQYAIEEMENDTGPESPDEDSATDGSPDTSG